MKLIELKAKIELFEREAKRLRGIKVDCHSCEHFGLGRKCKLADAVPPEDVLRNGCEEWTYDEVPF